VWKKIFNVKKIKNPQNILLVALLAFGTFEAGAQQPADSPARRANAQNLLIGLLTGQSDYREVTIRTGEGMFRVYGQGNSRPFEMLEGSPERLVIAFKLHGMEIPVNFGDERRPQKIIYQFFRTDRSLTSAIILDEIDYAPFESEAVAAEIANATRNYRILPLPAPAHAMEMIAYNLKHPILRERAVRQALSYAIHREEIKRSFFTTGADVGAGPFSGESRYSPPGVNEYNYNPKKALELLRAAGWLETNRDGILVRNGEPLRFQIFYDHSSQLKEDIIRRIKIRWNQINIDVIPQPKSFSEMQELLRTGNYDAVLLRHLFDETLTSLEEFFSPGFLNYDSPALQKAFVNAKKYQGTESFRQHMQYIQVVINRDQPVSFLYHPWQTWHAINVVKFENFLEGGKLKPFQEWQLKPRP
jgi:ABC-type transport system substrate-binding protein